MKLTDAQKKDLKEKAQYLQIGLIISNCSSYYKIESLMNDLEIHMSNKGKELTEDSKREIYIIFAKYVMKQLQMHPNAENLSFSIVDALLDPYLDNEKIQEITNKLDIQGKANYLATFKEAKNIEKNLAEMLNSKYNVEIPSQDPKENDKITLDSTDLENIHEVKHTDNFEQFEIDSKHRALYDSKGNIYVYDETSPLGEGANGLIYLATNIDTGEKVALKRTPLESNEEDNTREYKNSLKYYINGRAYAQNFGKYQSYNILVLQYIEGKPFGNNTKAENPPPEELHLLKKQALAIAKEIKRMHKECKIFHGDITPENIFINNANINEPKASLIDLGGAKDIRKKQDPVGFSAGYTAPEIFVELFTNLLGINKSSKITAEAIRESKEKFDEKMTDIEIKCEKLKMERDNLIDEIEHAQDDNEKKKLEKTKLELDEEIVYCTKTLKSLEKINFEKLYNILASSVCVQRTTPIRISIKLI